MAKMLSTIMFPNNLDSPFFVQAYETWESGWSFQVLSPVFGIHHGFQEKKFRPGILDAIDNLTMLS